MSKILITGGAGFIGAHLTERLLSLGHKVLVVDLMKSQGGIPFVSKRSKLIKGDIAKTLPKFYETMCKNLFKVTQ